jgi:hypothetical protein
VPEYGEVDYDSDISPHATDFQKSKYLKPKMPAIYILELGR